MMIKTGETSSYLQTVGRSLEILECIGAFPGLTLSEVARQCSMSTTVAYRLLYTLTVSGFLQQETGGKRYFLGDKALLIGVQSLDNREVKRIARYYMWDYYERTGEHCMLTIPCAGRSICIEKIGSTRDASNAVRSGGIYPMHKGASNRVLLAFLPPQEQQRCMDGLSMHGAPRQALEDKLKEIAACGYDFSEGTLTPDRFALAFPLFDRSRSLVGALSTGGYVSELTPQSRQTLVREFGRVAEQVNLAMGALPHVD